MMSRKHYQATAKLLNAEVNRVEPWLHPMIRNIAEGMCEIFEADNPRFSRILFLNAVFPK